MQIRTSHIEEKNRSFYRLSIGIRNHDEVNTESRNLRIVHFNLPTVLVKEMDHWEPYN